MAFKLASLLFASAAMAAKMGDSGALSSLDAGLGGTVEVVSNTELKITDYQLKDASAPALYWWGSKTDDLSSGFRINKERISDTSSKMDIMVKLDAGYTAKDFSYVGLWCEKFDANFGQAKLTSDGGSMNSTDEMDKKEDDMKKDEMNGVSGCPTGQPAMVVAILSLLAFSAYFA
ncbi:electron transfer DM13 domain-containing protein [Fusarium napiforme]|uniref:Electron transfer DM13 domain-containing protein n=1 Tax=Fusarium napiforme TaxID=42672 RepID=A0A8H5JB11_9HYPO|nr:electron transfer DM13 domain-containing protein [Fusarium napiforme]